MLSESAFSNTPFWEWILWDISTSLLLHVSPEEWLLRLHASKAPSNTTTDSRSDQNGRKRGASEVLPLLKEWGGGGGLKMF